MPTKRNRADQQQPYVPAGNGDASGEYADHSSGSNKHFTSFRKPETQEDHIDTNTNGKHTSLKERLNLTEDIEKNIKSDLKWYLNNDISKETIRKRLTEKLLNGSYGFITRTQEEMGKGFEDYYDDMDVWIKENTPEKMYYKKGGKWASTYSPYFGSGTKYFTEQEYQQKLSEEATKNLKQSEADIKINNILGKDCLVSFGKKYSDDYMREIVDSTQRVVDDFPEIKGFVKAIGDRTSLEKLSSARAFQQLTPENIDKVAKEYINYQKEIFNRDISMEDAVKHAKTKIQNSGLSLSRASSNTLAYWSPSERALVMLPKTNKENAAETQERMFEVNWHSSNKPMATYYHEFGHAIDSMMGDLKRQKRINILTPEEKDFVVKFSELYDKNINSKYNDEFVKRYNDILGTNYQSKRDIDIENNRFYNREKYEASVKVKESLKNDNIKKYAVSEYGNTNQSEFIAECFSAYYTGMNNELANEVVKLIKDYYNYLRSA